MKRLVVAAVIPAACLCGCKSSRTAAADTETHISVTDTTETRAFAVLGRSEDAESDSTGVSREDAVAVEFADGGSIRIGGDGEVVLAGVKNLSGNRATSFRRAKSKAAASETAAARTESRAGVAGERTERTSAEERQGRAERWYDTPVMWVCRTGFVALLIWLLYKSGRKRE